MRSWKEAFEDHFTSHLGTIKQRLVARVGFDETEMLLFDFSDRRRVFCTLGVCGAWPGPPAEEFVMVAPAAEATEVAYVFINSVREMRRWLRPDDPYRVVPLGKRVCPEFIRKWHKTALLVREGLGERLPSGLSQLQNGPREGRVSEAVFLTAAEHGFLQQEGQPALDDIFVRDGVDLTSLDRPSAVEEGFAGLRELAPRWLPSLVVPKESERKVLELGGQRSEQTWWVPAHLDPFAFDRWLSPESRSMLAESGPVQLMPASTRVARRRARAGAPPIRKQAAEAPPDRLTYEFQDEMGTSVLHESEIRVLRGSTIQFQGKFYELSGRMAPGPIHCAEVPAPFFEASRTAFAEEVGTFLAKRGREGGQMTEEALKETVLGVLGEWFEVDREIWGTHPFGTRMRIDAILRPKALKDWRTKDIALGLEFKNPAAAKSQASRDGAVMAQALDYAMCDFEGYGQILVFVCPTPVHLRGEITLFRFLAHYHVGYVDLETKRGITFYLGERSRILWSEVEGVAQLGRSADLARKYGNRSRRRREGAGSLQSDKRDPGE